MTVHGKLAVADNDRAGLCPTLDNNPAHFLNGQGAWAAAGGGGDIALTLLAPLVDEKITAGYSAIAVRSYAVASGKKLIIGSGARFRIL